MLQYEFAIELNEKLENYTRQENNYKDMMLRLNNDYNNFLKTGASLTLTEQKKTEESLKKRADELAKMEERLMNERSKLESVIQLDQKKMIDAVYAFVRDYNAKHQQFNVILKKSFSESPVLYMDDDMDITREIIDGLNEEYRNVKGK
jgi:outer membrane protein